MTNLVYGSVFGTPIDVSGYTAHIYQPELKLLSDGRTVLAWVSEGNESILFRVFNPDGSPQTDTISVLDEGRRGNQPSISELADGTLWISFAAFPERGFIADIKARRFETDGTQIGDEVTLFSSAEDIWPSLRETVVLNDGSLVSVFDVPNGLDGDRRGVFAQRSDASGAPIGDLIQVNQTIEDSQKSDSVIALPDGGFAVAWNSDDVDGSFDAAMLRLFNADGTPRTDEIRLNQYGLSWQRDTAITVLNDGRLAVAWESENQDGSGRGIYARILSAEGIPLTTEFGVPTRTLDNQSNPSISATPNGGFVVAWDNVNQQGDVDIRFQNYDSFGVRVGAEIVIRSGVYTIEQGPQIVVSSEGFLHLSWVSMIFNQFKAAYFHASATPTVLGTAGHDTLNGTVLSDQYLGQHGDDLLIASPGNDALDGGDGSDTVSYEFALDGVDIDLKLPQQSEHVDIGSDTFSSIENVIGSGFVDYLTGDDADNILHGMEDGDVLTGNGGDDRLDGGADNDTLRGGDGDDRMFGGLGNDFLIGGNGNDLLEGNDGDDNLAGSGGNDTLVGHDGNDIARGEAGNDRVIGGAGNDILSGQAGQDVLEGGEGNDRLSGGSQVDILRGNQGDDDIEGGGGHDEIFGGDDNDFLRGNTGDDRLLGEDGDDRLGGAQGDDYLDGGRGRDSIRGGSGADEIYAGFDDDIVNGDSGDDRIFGGGGDDILDGAGGNDRILGDDGNDIVTGGIGNDALFGNKGDDQLFGGDGNDVLLGGLGADVVHGGEGRDEIFGDSADDHLMGDGGNDAIAGNAGNDVASGGDGDDRVFGNSGDDTVSGNAGNDFLNGGEGNDILQGGDGNDGLYAERGEDTLIAGRGADTLSGGSVSGERDVFVFGLASDGHGGFNRIVDFENGVDQIDLSGFGFTDFDAQVLPFAFARDNGNATALVLEPGYVIHINGLARSAFDVSDVVL